MSKVAPAEPAPETDAQVATAVPPSETSAQAVAVPASKGGQEDVKECLLDLVVAKTGYPKDMLDLELDLEADLGVDTVKQAELFAAIREIYNIPRDQNLKLRDFPTLAHVIQFVYDKRPDLAPMETHSRAEVQPVVLETTLSAKANPGPELPAMSIYPVADGSNVTEESIKEKVLEIVAEKTGYPKDMLDLDLDLEADLGVDTVKQAEMFAAVRQIYNIPRDQNLRLRDFPTLGPVNEACVGPAPGKQATPKAEPAGAYLRRDDSLARDGLSQTSATGSPSAPKRRELASLDPANAIPRRVPVPTLRRPCP